MLSLSTLDDTAVPKTPAAPFAPTAQPMSTSAAAQTIIVLSHLNTHETEEVHRPQGQKESKKRSAYPAKHYAQESGTID